MGIFVDLRRRVGQGGAMPRRLRVAMGGLAYHVFNRRVRRACVFGDDVDYAAFERMLGEAQERTGMRIVCYWVMSNPWRLRGKRLPPPFCSRPAVLQENALCRIDIPVCSAV